MGQRQLESTYCDDIRMELGGKLSFIGVYNGGMLVPGFPATLPKFYIAFKVLIPSDNPSDSVTIRVLKGEQLIGEMKYDSPQHPIEGMPDSVNLKDLERVTIIQSAFAFSPLVIEAPCNLKLRALTSDGEELKGLALSISAPPEGQASSPAT